MSCCILRPLLIATQVKSPAGQAAAGGRPAPNPPAPVQGTALKRQREDNGHGYRPGPVDRQAAPLQHQAPTAPTHPQPASGGHPTEFVGHGLQASSQRPAFPFKMTFA
jgi:hypothetical protein